MKRSAILVATLAPLATLSASLSVGLVTRMAIAAEDGTQTPTAAAPTIVLRATGSKPGHEFIVEGLSERELAAFEKLSADEKGDVFRVFVVGPLENPPAVAGASCRAGSRLSFTPRFPPVPGVKYRAVLDRARLTGDSTPEVVLELMLLSRPDSELPTVVSNIYPTVERLPENQLKFYLRFSNPMSRGEAYQHVRLLDDKGRPVDGAFLELGEELWDGDQMRFTLLMDPGRVKRGLKPREDLGPVLVEGRSYTLFVDAPWRDADHRPLMKPVEKKFTVGPPDETPIDPTAWKLVPPPVETSEPLVVHLGEPLDFALLERMVWVEDSSGRKIAGKITSTDHESVWKLTPRAPWRAGSYQLVADTRLEDLAGNSIGRAFEVDEFAPIKTKIEAQTVKVPFEIKAAR